MEYIAVPFTHSGAIKYEKFLKEKNIKCTLMPIPRKLSSSCGIGVRFNYSKDISLLILDEIEKVFSSNSGEYKIVYKIDE